MILMGEWIDMNALIQNVISDEEPYCQECGHLCSVSDWDGECVKCERRHMNDN